MAGRILPILLGAAGLLGFHRTLSAQDPLLPKDLASELRGADPPFRATSEEHLARQLVDPLDDLANVAIQGDFDGDLGPDQAGLRNTITLQPILPMDLGEDWLIIARTFAPIVYQRNVLGEGTGRAFGLGDFFQTFYVTPKNAAGLQWGFGPALLWPTATREVLGRGKWAAGPAGALVAQSGLWTAGVLVDHLWSYAGSDSRANVNRTAFQPFLAVTFPKATTLFFEAEAEYDWHVTQWTVPLIAGVSQVMKFGDQAVSLGIDGKYWVAGPSTAPDWGVRFVITFVFPR
jgi:hypothetical protein